jgi:hypothetical protein
MEARHHLCSQSPGLYWTPWFTSRYLPHLAGLFTVEAPEIFVTRTCNHSNTSKSPPVYEDGICKEFSRIYGILGSQRSDDDDSSLLRYDTVSIGK